MPITDKLIFYMKKSLKYLCIFLSVPIALADEPTHTRDLKRFGIFAGVGFPALSQQSIGLDYNILSFAKFEFGVGHRRSSVMIADGPTLTFDNFPVGFGLKILHPTWDISPSLGIAYRLDDGSFGNLISWTAGVDWQHASGATVGAGINCVTTLPYCPVFYGSLGWHFNLFGNDKTSDTALKASDAK